MAEIPDVKAKHIGRNIERIREIKGIKQETLATELGISQQAVSKMEQSETIDEEKLQKVAKILGVTPEAIKSFNEEATINNFFGDQNNHDSSSNVNGIVYYPLETIKELYEKLLSSEREKLESEKEKVKLLEDKVKSLQAENERLQKK